MAQVSPGLHLPEVPATGQYTPSEAQAGRRVGVKVQESPCGQQRVNVTSGRPLVQMTPSGGQQPFVTQVSAGPQTAAGLPGSPGQTLPEELHTGRGPTTVSTDSQVSPCGQQSGS